MTWHCYVVNTQFLTCTHSSTPLCYAFPRTGFVRNTGQLSLNTANEKFCSASTLSGIRLAGPCHVSVSVPSSLADTIRKILAVRGLTLSHVARASRSLAPSNPLQHIPHNLYSALRTRSFSPNVFQIFAFSIVTGYYFGDWLSVFGFSLRDVPRFQAGFPAVRTVELDASDLQPRDALPWFNENQAPDFSAPLLPLGRWLALTTPAFFRTPTTVNSNHRYVKIGSQDAFAFPELIPGSIIRVTTSRASSATSARK